MPQNWKGECLQLGLASFLAIGGAIALSADGAIAQITPDGTLGAESSVVTPTNIDGIPTEQRIDGGATRGANLFHSFEQFSVPPGGSAYFNNAPAIQNIFSRVTGSSRSNIDGLLRANCKANLFVFNPNGIIFGPNARLNIGGSFLGSTASSLKFADGTQFSATAPQTTPLLTVSVPIGLQFGGTAGDISIQKSGLEVDSGKTLALVGGNVTLFGGELAASEKPNLAAPGGRIELGSVALVGEVSLNDRGNSWVLGYDHVNAFGTILLHGAYVELSGEGGGSLQIQGAHLEMRQGSLIFADTQSTGAGGEVFVHTTNTITLSEGSQITADVLRKGTGTGGNVTIETGQLSILKDGSRIRAGTRGEGQGGNLTVTASDSVKLDGTEKSGLFTQTEGAGDAGDLTISTRHLRIQNGARVSASATPYSTRNAGDLTVRASEIELVGTTADGKYPSGLFTQALGTGDAGDLTINTRHLRAQHGAQVSNSTSGARQGKNLEVTASESIELIGTSIATSADKQFPSGLFTQAQGTGAAGNLKVATGQLIVRDGAVVSVSSKGVGAAGDLTVSAGSIELSNQSSIRATTAAAGNQGNITLRSPTLVLRRSSQITTDAKGTGTGGNITINTGVLAALENSDISASASEGPGGRITINAQGVFGTKFQEKETSQSDIRASSNLGPEFNGIVEINSPDVDTSFGLVALPAELVDASRLIASGCGAAGRQGESEFIVTGRGGLPPNPSETLSSDTVWSDLRYRTQLSENLPMAEEATQPSNPTPGQLVEAQGWVINNKGEVVLTAHAPNVTPHIPWLTPVTCHTP